MSPVSADGRGGGGKDPNKTTAKKNAGPLSTLYVFSVLI
jgi:hypothetical protein